MTERPILYSGEMVLAILDDRKTQTRRLITGNTLTFLNGFFGASNAPEDEQSEYGQCQYKECINVYLKEYPEEGFEMVKCPYGHVGDRLWVRESWMPWHQENIGYCIKFKADEGMEHWGKRNGINEYDNKYKPSIHMPRWVSRITLEIINVRVERLNDCTDADAMAEGLKPSRLVSRAALVPVPHIEGASMPCKPVYAYKRLWESHYGKGSWELNPWVWVIEFKRII